MNIEIDLKNNNRKAKILDKRGKTQRNIFNCEMSVIACGKAPTNIVNI